VGLSVVVVVVFGVVVVVVLGVVVVVVVVEVVVVVVVVLCVGRLVVGALVVTSIGRPRGNILAVNGYITRCVFTFMIRYGCLTVSFQYVSKVFS